jgi:hypothetical protein
LTEISVEDLKRFNLAHLAAADVNQDGMLDVRDISAFMQGARPVTQHSPGQMRRSTSHK